MGKKIGIIDCDACFTRLLAQRIRLRNIDKDVIVCNSVNTESVSDLLAQVDTLIYNPNDIAKEQILSLISDDHFVHLIPLQNEESANAPRSACSLLQIAERREKPYAAHSSGTVVELLCSFTTQKDRELYYQKLLLQAKQEAMQVIRIDFMPGINMSFNPGQNMNALAFSISGVHRLLADLDLKTFSYEKIGEYMTTNAEGTLLFGRPLRSDEIINAPIEKLISWLLATIEYANAMHTPTRIIVVTEALPFSKLNEIARYANNIHAVTAISPANDRLFSYEMDSFLKDKSNVRVISPDREGHMPRKKVIV